MEATYLLNHLREVLADEPVIDEKRMFGGTCFMLNHKMCICINGRELLCRIGEEKVAHEIEKGTCRHMMMNGRTSKDYVYVELDSLRSIKDVGYWLDLCLAFNPMAKASKKT